MKRADVLQSFTPPVNGAPQTLILRFGGARVKGRARTVRWNGRIRVEHNSIAEAKMTGI